MAPSKDLSSDPKLIDEPIIPLDDSFSDERGDIIPLVDEDMQSAVLIRSKKGTTRANHYHKTDWHYCYVTKGEIDYYFRRAKTSDELKKVTIKVGEMFFTPPMVEHVMCFTQDTEFFCFGRNPRDQESYESDIERIELARPSGDGFEIVV